MNGDGLEYKKARPNNTTSYDFNYQLSLVCD